MVRARRSKRAISADAVRPLPTNGFSNLLHRQYPSRPDYEEFPTRDQLLAAELIDLVNGCPEVGSALEIICAYCLSSGTGDEMGFAVLPPKELDSDGKEIKVKHTPTVLAARALLDRCFSLEDYWQIIWRSLAWGDAFLYLEMTPKQIEKVLLLPTWQCFVMPSETTYQVDHYEQKINHLQTEMISPLSMVHFAYNKRHLYGRSLFSECLNDWDALKAADMDIRDATRGSVIQPNLHIMPAGADEAYKQTYKRDHEARLKIGIIPDIYLLQGADVKKPTGLPASFPITGMISSYDLRRLRIAARSRVPLYLLGIETKYAREIAYQPALAFVVFVGTIRQMLAAGLRRVIDRQLALENLSGDYRIVFPTINVNPWQPAVQQDVNDPQVEDLD